MLKRFKMFIFVLGVMMAMNSRLFVFASEEDSHDPVFAADIDIVDLDFPEYSESEPVDSNIIDDAPTSYCIDETGDVYSNGNLIYNTSTKVGNYLHWQRTDKVSWGSGYEQRTHMVLNATVKGMSKLASYSSKNASSNYVVLLYCDEDTEFSYVHTYYQSAPDHIYDSTTVDTTGRETPRKLDSVDFAGGAEP